MAWTLTAAQVYADGPIGSPSQPDKAQIRPLLLQYENSIDTLTLMLGASAGAVKATKSALDASASAYSDGAIGVVFADTDILNGIYLLVGGIWIKQRSLPGFAADAAAAASAASAALSQTYSVSSAQARDQSQAYSGQAQSSASLANSSSAIAITAAANAVAAVDVANLGKGYDTYALANAAVASLPDQQIVTVFVDENHDGGRTLYRKESGALVFKTVLYQGRLKLTTSKTYYVRTDGNDSNNGLANSSGGAFATIQHAWDVASQLDTNRQQVKIKIIDGTYTVGLQALSSLVGNGLIVIEGNLTTPANVFINTVNSDCFAFDYGARAQINGVKMSATGSSSVACIRTSNFAIVGQGGNEFGACGGMQIDMGLGGVVYNTASYTISGSAAGHWHAGEKGSIIECGTITVTLTGTPAFGSYFAGCRDASIDFAQATFSGAATGVRYYVHANGVIDGAGASETALPGDQPGVKYTGGEYLGNQGFPTVDGRDLQFYGGTIAHSGFSNVLELTTEYAGPLTLRETNGAPTSGPFLTLDRNSVSPANNDGLAVVSYSGRNFGGSTVNYVQHDALATNVAVGSESAVWRLSTYYNGALAARLNVLGGAYMTGASGGDKGPGTFNATAVYDDNTLLTCMALAKEFFASGTVDLDKWDAFAPSLVIPAQTNSVPVMEEQTVAKTVLVKTDDGLVAAVEHRPTMVQVVDLVPVWDQLGNGVDAVLVPRTEDVTTAEQTIPRIHRTARVFKAMLDAGFDPRDPQQYFDKLRADEALPGMPTQVEWTHGDLSMGDLFTRKWLAVEMLAIVCNVMWIKLQDHEQRLVAAGF